MRYTDEEVRPLTGPPNNGHTAAGATAGTAGPRSRKPPSSIGQHRGGRHGGGMEHFRSSKANEDFSKKPTDHHRRRSLLGYCTSCTSSAVAICCARPSTSTNSPFDYYEDTFNDEAWECTFGTSGQDGVWVNCGDQVGQIMSTTVWILMSYSVLTIMLLANHQNLPNTIAMAYGTVCALALASHAKTMFTDPGSIPAEAVPRATLFKQGVTTHSMCSHCQVYKPPNSHHCRICNRCISRMDHHCPWMNNCVGASNFSKYIQYILFGTVDFLDDTCRYICAVLVANDSFFPLLSAATQSISSSFCVTRGLDVPLHLSFLHAITSSVTVMIARLMWFWCNWSVS